MFYCVCNHDADNNCSCQQVNSLIFQDIQHTFWSNSQLTCGSSSALVVCQQGQEQAGCILLPALEIGQGKLHKMGLLLLLAAPEVLLRSIKTWHHPYFIWKSQPSCQPFALDAHKDKGVLSCKGSNWKETHVLSPWLFPFVEGATPEACTPHYNK